MPLRERSSEYKPEEKPTNDMHYVGLDIHKKTISYRIRQSDGTILQENTIAATLPALEIWMRHLPQPWTAGMEATVFTGLVYDYLGGSGATVKVAHSTMLKAIAAGKKKDDQVDARKIADLLRCDYFPGCHNGTVRDSRSKACVAQSQPAGEAGRTDEEQGKRTVDGGGTPGSVKSMEFSEHPDGSAKLAHPPAIAD
jgi:hypothetical protein